MESRAPLSLPAISPSPSSLPAKKPLSPSGATASSSESEAAASSSDPEAAAGSSGSGDGSGSDGSSDSDQNPSILAPWSLNKPLRDEIRAKNKPCCPFALSTALQSLAAQASSPSSSSTSSSRVSSPSSPPRASPSAPPVVPSLDVSLGGSSLPEPSLGPDLDASALPQNQPPLPPLAAVPSLRGPRPAAVAVPDGPPPSTGAANATTGAVIDDAKATATTVSAAVAVDLPIDRALFLKNQAELNSIRAQLKSLRGKEHVNPRRGGLVEGRNNKMTHTTYVTSHARKVFDNMSKPILAGPMASAGLGGHPPTRAPPPPPLRKAWVAAVSSNLNEKKFNMTYRAPKVMNGKPIVVASDEALDLARTRWSEYLVGYFLEGRLPFPSVEDIAKRMWAKQGLIETLSFNKEFFLFKFPDESSRQALLDHGPFLFAGRPLILQRWSPSLKLFKEAHSKIPLWVKIHNIPLAMWNPIGLGDIASAIGNPLYVDNVTETLQRLDFARICIEVDAFKPLLDAITLQVGDEMITLLVEYQWRPKRCPLCCSFGHICKPTPTIASVSQTAPIAVSSASKSAAPTSSFAAATAADHALVHAEKLAFAPPSSVAASGLVAAAETAAAATSPATGSRSGGMLPVQCLNPATSVGASVHAPALDVTNRFSPITHPPAIHHVEGMDYELSDENPQCDEDDSDVSLEDTPPYAAPLSPKTRGQKARKELALQPPRGSSQRKKKRGKRAKR